LEFRRVLFRSRHQVNKDILLAERLVNLLNKPGYVPVKSHKCIRCLNGGRSETMPDIVGGGICNCKIISDIILAQLLIVNQSESQFGSKLVSKRSIAENGEIPC